LENVTRLYLDAYGYNDVRITTVFHQWMGGFPQDEAKAFSVISWGAAAASLAKATKVIVKTPHEAIGVPTKEANAAGLKATKQLASMLIDQNLLNIPAVLFESDIIVQEMECILGRVEDLGKGDIAIGTIAAFEAGIIDIPFAPSKYNLGKLMPARDNDGAVRLLAPGNLPLSKSLLQFHKDKLEERAKFENRPVSFHMVIDDVYAIGKGFLVGKPDTKFKY
jgi:methylaspartate mutase epsilon subunit